MGLLDPYRASRLSAVLQEENIAKPRSHGLVKGAFPVCSLQVYGTTDRFLRTVVEIVPKGAYLGLRLNSHNQLVVLNDQ